MIAPRTRTFLAAALLATATLLAFAPVWHGRFIFDDDVFVTGNPLIHAADGLRRLWFSREPVDYWPVASSTLWLEWRLWGTSPAGYHLTNLALHLAEALLFWAVLHRMKMPGAFVAALVFALHPLNAATVGWVTERKNLVAMLFYLATAWFFLGAAHQARDRSPHPRLEYALSLAAFALAMLSKSSVLTLPLVLVGLVAWNRRLTATDALRLAPFWAIAAGLALFQSQFSTVLGPTEVTPLGWIQRAARAAAVLLFYIGKMIWPAGLSFDYGLWPAPTLTLAWCLPAVVVLVVTAALWRFRETGTRALLGAWLFIGISLLPVLGFVEVGFMKYSPVANHYTHLALLGFAAWGGFAWERIASAVGRRAATAIVRPALAAAVVLPLGALTFAQARIYADPRVLYADTLAHNPRSWLAHTNVAVMALDRGEPAMARAHLETAVALKPDFAPAHNDLGIVLYRSNENAAAIREYREAIRLNPYFYQARNNLGAALARSGDLRGAITEFEAAVQLAPDYQAARSNLEKARLKLAAP